jgi:hypothetical protein
MKIAITLALAASAAAFAPSQTSRTSMQMDAALDDLKVSCSTKERTDLLTFGACPKGI